MAVPNAVLQNDPDRTGTLVIVFLRGGADGLNMVVPVNDDGYHARRPQIGVQAKEAVPLDGFFGLHPQLKALKPAYDEGDLLLVHQAGSEDSTRSHFEAQDLMEHGGAAAGGWLGRYLRERPSGEAGPLTAVALGKSQPEALRGAPASVAMESPDTFEFGEAAPAFRQALGRLYKADPTALGTAGRDTLQALDRLNRLRGKPYRPSREASYSSGAFGVSLRQAAQLIKACVGVEAVCVDLDGWDTHFTQGPVMAPRLRELAQGLAAFRIDLGTHIETTTVVVMSEFGRRAYENASFGTDHGRGGVMFVMGHGIKGGRVLADWRRIADVSLEGPGDLPVVHNYRDILAPVLHRHSGLTDLTRVFPGHTTHPIAL